NECIESLIASNGNAYRESGWFAWDRILLRELLETDRLLCAATISRHDNVRGRSRPCSAHRQSSLVPPQHALGTRAHWIVPPGHLPAIPSVCTSRDRSRRHLNIWSP